jgi:hypothetical protein
MKSGIYAQKQTQQRWPYDAQQEKRSDLGRSAPDRYGSAGDSAASGGTASVAQADQKIRRSGKRIGQEEAKIDEPV